MAKLPTIILAAASTMLVAVPMASAQNTDISIANAADLEFDAARTRIRNGIEVLRPTDEEHTAEQYHFACNGTSCLLIGMGTDRLDSPAGPNTGPAPGTGNIQGACIPFSLVQDETSNSGIIAVPDLANSKYITNRNSDENRAFHNPNTAYLGTFNNMELFTVWSNWDRNDNTNTERYLQVVDNQCNLYQLTANVTTRENNTSAMVMQKDNDNCSGTQVVASGTNTFAFIATTSVGQAGNPGRIFYTWDLCNGNGRDDGWINAIAVSCQDQTLPVTCEVEKLFDTSVIAQEERSRGNVYAYPAMNLVVGCGTNGNSQPQREGIYCSGVDATTGERLWRERIAYRSEDPDGRRTYAMRVKSNAIVDLQLQNTPEVEIEYQYHRGNNNNNRKGGYDANIIRRIATPTRAGLNAGPEQDITQLVINAGVEMTHASQFQTFKGELGGTITPSFAYLSPNHNGNSIRAKLMEVELVNNQATNSTVFTLGGPADGQKYSKYLGNNPNDQGRGFVSCGMISNPFVDTVGTKASGIPVYNACAMTGKLTSDASNPAQKPDVFIEIWTSIGPAAPPDESGDEPNEPSDPTDPTDPNDPNSSTTSGGCSASGGSAGSSAALLLLAFAFIGIRRRRN